MFPLEEEFGEPWFPIVLLARSATPLDSLKAQLAPRNYPHIPFRTPFSSSRLPF